MNRRRLLLAVAGLAAMFRAVPALGTDYQVAPTSAPQVSCAIILTGTQTTDGTYVLGPLGHFTGQFGPNTVDWTISAECQFQTSQFDVPPPTTTTTLPPSTGTTWLLTVKERDTCCAGGRCEGFSAGFSSSLVLESDGTYRASETCLKTGGPLPDNVGEVRPLSRRRFALLTPTNLDEIAEALRECAGYDSLVLRAFRNRLKIAKDGLSLRGTLSYAGRYSQSGTVVACRVSGSYRGTLSK